MSDTTASILIYMIKFCAIVPFSDNSHSMEQRLAYCIRFDVGISW